MGETVQANRKMKRITMDQMRNISVKPGVLESIVPYLEKKTETSRYDASYAVWQLARMGSYNAAGELPLAIRLEATGDYSELYATYDRFVCPVDVTDADVLNTASMVEALVRSAVFLARSRRDNSVEILIMTPSKMAEQSPEKLAEWDIPESFTQKVFEHLEILRKKEIIRGDIEIKALVSKTVERSKMLHVRRRHGHLGDDALTGRELDAVKVLQDAGINGRDLSGALANLVVHATGKHQKRKKTGVVFGRHEAMLMIRDHQRRARIQRPGVRVIDASLIEKESDDVQIIPRSPTWKKATSDFAIRRNCFESAVRWARLAALKSGRGLLPVFYFSGDEGSGRSFLLKQVAWELYNEGFAIAEIVNLEDAAKEAEGLAAAAVALDAPLILVWDDAHEPGIDALQAIREFSESQVSGVPIIFLSAASDLGYNPKKIRQLSRVSFEEFEVHSLDESECTTVFPVSPEDYAVQDNDKLSDESPTDMSDKSIAETDSEESLKKLQEMQTDEVMIMVSKPQSEKRKAMIEAIVDLNKHSSWDEYVSHREKTLFAPVGDTKPIIDLLCSLGMIGFPVPERMALAVSGNEQVETFKKRVQQNNALEISVSETSEGYMWDIGHPVLARAIVAGHDYSEGELSEILEKAITSIIHDKPFQLWTGRILRALYGSGAVSETTIDVLTQTIVRIIQSDTAKISPLVLSDLYLLATMVENELLQNAVVDELANYARLNAVNSFIALTPLLRNRIGGIEDSETLDMLKAAKPDEDRVAFKFLLKFLGDHQPNEISDVSVDNARTAAARAPDQGFAVAAYLRFCWARGTDEQIKRSIEETRSWLQVTPDDRVVRRAYMDYVVTKGSEELRRESIEPLEDWLEDHIDEGPLRNSLIELAFSLNDPAIADRILETIARWIERRGNNRTVRHNYFRRAERRNDSAIMKRACDVAVAWLNNHPDDRETVYSLLFIASRLDRRDCPVSVFNAIHSWLSHHVIERDLLRRYLILADKAGRGRAITHAAEIGQKWLYDNPDDTDIREILLGMAARKVDRKIQVRIYDGNVQWLESLTETQPMMEYMIGRLGVRAGVGRRAIPLLERAVTGAEGDLRNHARLWLGSAYRAAGAFKEARNVWQAVKDDGVPEFVNRADKNLKNLDDFLNEKFPNGYPPPSEKPAREKPSRFVGETDKKFSEKPQFKYPKTENEKDSRRRRPKQSASDRPPGPSRQKKTHPHKTETKRRSGATLGDLLRMKGMDLSNLQSESEKESE
jgi:hypothetical protein